MGEAAPEQRALVPGTMLDDKYRVDRLLAVGGMGAVYEGTHIKLRKRVAIKVLNPAMTSQSMIDRFHREAITASQIGHEGIAQVTDLGTSMTGEPFLVMELLEGEPLSARLKAVGGPLPIEMACELGCAILSPLAAAHAAGIVHRDLKPDNVFLVRQSRGEMVKLLDFGISRAQGLEQEFRLTTTGLVLGTPYYMSPEQARGETHVTPAADIYAFGVILYEMLVGDVPIKADNYNQLMYRVMSGDFARPRSKRQDVPVPLEEIVMRAMALEPEHRWSHAAELEQHLLQFCRPTFRDHMIERISGSNIGFKSSSPLLPTPMNPTPAPATKSSSKRIVPIVLAGVAAGGIAIAIVVARGGKDTKAADAPVATASSSPTPAGATNRAGESAEAKPIDTNPVDTKPVDTKPVDTKSIDTKPVEPAKITIKFEVEPQTATIAIDGKPLDGSSLEVTKDDATHQVEITAKGFQPYKEDLSFVETQKLVVHLDKVGARPTKKQGGKDPKDHKTDHIDTNSPYGN